jgi:hypothetical protein
MKDGLGIKGHVISQLWKPRTNLLGHRSGERTRGGLILADRQEMENLVTDVGDQMYGDAYAGLHANATVTDPDPVTGMQLGTGATAAAKTGAGAATVTYISGSNVAIDAGFPTSTSPGAARRISWETTWGAGVATNAAIAEAVITNDIGLPDVTSIEADTISRVVFGATIDKQAGDTLVVTWHHDLLGA